MGPVLREVGRRLLTLRQKLGVDARVILSTLHVEDALRRVAVE